jgi:hypothetical protein
MGSTPCSFRIDRWQVFHLVRDHPLFKPTIQCRKDNFQRALQVLQHVNMPNPQDRPPVPIHRLVTIYVPYAARVLTSIYLDHEVLFTAGEIRKEESHGKLAYKLVAVEPAGPKLLPDQFLCAVCDPAQVAGTRSPVEICSTHFAAPHPPFGHFLPVNGEKETRRSTAPSPSSPPSRGRRVRAGAGRAGAAGPPRRRRGRSSGTRCRHSG